MLRTEDAFIDRPGVGPRPASPQVRAAPARDLWSRTLPLVTHRVTLLLLLLGIAFVARMVQLGNPVIQVDDDFYLLVGDRMLHGALPFVDIWDRKPIGLFLLYAGFRSLGGDGVLQYQLAAIVSVALTAWSIARIASRYAGAHGAAAAGVVYILYLGIFGGDGGQSPVFYNLPMVGAAALMVRIVARDGFDARSMAGGMAAMLLVGLSLQIKYSVVFEGLFFGLYLMGTAYRRGWSLPRVAGAGLLWAAIAGLPTLAAWAAYIGMGHGAEFVQANFLSILVRGSDGTGGALHRLFSMTCAILPLGVAAFFACRIEVRPAVDAALRARAFAIWWAVAAIGGVLVFGTYFDHYALPLLPPLCAIAAPLLGNPGSGVTLRLGDRALHVPAAIALMLIALAIAIPTVDKDRHNRGTGPEVRRLAAFIAPRLGGGCLYVYYGDPALYRLTGSCLPTRWVFPNHLNYSREAPALGVDAVAETARIMAQRPPIVVTTTRLEKEVNPATWAVVRDALARDYRLALAVPVGTRVRLVYERRPGL